MRPLVVLCLLASCSRAMLDDTAPDADCVAAPPPDAGKKSDASIADASDASSAPDVPHVDAAGAEPCLVGGNVFHVEGDPGDPVYPGTATITSGDGTWAGMMPFASDVQVGVSQDSLTQWAFVFRDGFDNVLDVKEYDNVTTVPTTQGRFLALYMDGRTCLNGTARVTIVTLDSQPNLLSLTATFEVHCGAITPAVRGCVHYQP
jgi:hypothetical protein